MAKDVTIRVVATDGASPVFKTIGQNAVQATNQIEQGNQRAARSMQDMEQRAVAIGAALGTVFTGMSLAGQAAADQERQIRGIEVAYGDASKELLQFADHMQDVTNYSNDAARASLLTAATITQQYGIASDQVDDLVARSADLAQVFGYDLADATGRVTAAIRGEAEAAEALGIAMSDTVLQQRAAQMGLEGWNTTMSEAEKAQVRFAVLMEQTAYVSGEATRAHEGTRGTIIELGNEFQDAGAKVGEFLGPLGEATSVLGNLALTLPLVGAGFGKLFSGLSAAGLPAATLIPLLLGAGTAYIGTQAIKDSSQAGSSMPLDIWNSFFGTASGVMNWALPGNPYDTGRYSQANTANKFEDVMKALFFMDPNAIGQEDPDYAQALFDRLITFGLVSKDDTRSRDEILVDLWGRAGQAGMSAGQYIESYLNAPGSNAVFDPVTGTYMDKGEYVIYQRVRAENRAAMIQQTATSYSGSPGTQNFGALQDPFISPALYPTSGTWRNEAGRWVPRDTFRTNTYLTAEGDAVARSMALYGPQSAIPGRNFSATSGDTAIGGTGGSIDGGNRAGAYTPPPDDPGWFPTRMANPQADYIQMTRDAEAYTAALREQWGAYAGVVEGINSANDAQSAFHATQTIVLEQQAVYTGQLSEYSQQEQALTDAYDILTQRRAEGIALTTEEQALLDNYPELYERITGGQEDATVAAGLLAATYIENMKIGDQMNESIANQTSSFDNLSYVLGQYILLMGEVPDEVRTEILLQNADNSIADLIAYYTWLNSLPGHVTTVVETQFVESGTGGGGRFRGAMDGWTVPAFANGGTAYDPLMPRFANGGTYALVGEVGPELVKLSRGDQVIPTGASRSMLQQGGRRSGGVNFYGPVTLQPASQNVEEGIRTSALGESRY